MTAYRFHVHRRVSAWRLVTADGAPFPAEGVESDWDFTRVRTAEDTNPDVRGEVGETDYCLFRIGARFGDVEG